MHQQAAQFDNSSVCTLPQAGLQVPAVGRLVPRLHYLCLKGGGPHEAQTSEYKQGWAGPPGLSGCGCHAADAFCCGLGGKEEEELMLRGGGQRGKKMSNAMSHSA